VDKLWIVIIKYELPAIFVPGLKYIVMPTGYSGTPLLNKLGIKPALKVLLINPPENYMDLLESNITDQLCNKKDSPDIIHLFVKNDLVDVKVCAVSEIWSGLKLVVPLTKR